jgi:hypothetical protein
MQSKGFSRVKCNVHISCCRMCWVGARLATRCAAVNYSHLGVYRETTWAFLCKSKEVLSHATFEPLALRARLLSVLLCSCRIFPRRWGRWNWISVERIIKSVLRLRATGGLSSSNHTIAARLMNWVDYRVFRLMKDWCFFVAARWFCGREWRDCKIERLQRQTAIGECFFLFLLLYSCACCLFSSSPRRARLSSLRVKNCVACAVHR